MSAPSLTRSWYLVQHCPRLIWGLGVSYSVFRRWGVHASLSAPLLLASVFGQSPKEEACCADAQSGNKPSSLVTNPGGASQLFFAEVQLPGQCRWFRNVVLKRGLTPEIFPAVKVKISRQGAGVA